MIELGVRRTKTHLKQIPCYNKIDFSQDDNDVTKKKKAAARALARKTYNTTKVKTRNFLTNIDYRRYKKSDFNNGNFVIDVYSFLLQNPLMVDRKFDNENDRQCVKMLWQKCLLQQFTQYIFLYDNFLALTQMEITYQKANSVVKQFLTEHLSEHYLAENAKVIQYLYATLLPKYYSRNNKFGIQNISLVDLASREWIFNIKDKPQVAKDPNNYRKPERNINEFQQVPIKEKESSPPLQKLFLLPPKQ